MSEREDEQAVVIERHVAAPADLVWQLWTDPEHFKAWYGPTGASIPVAEFDLRIGGGRKVCMEMQTPDGTMQMWFVGEHRVVEPVTRLVYTESMADADGNVAPAEQRPPGHPESTEVRVDLRVDGDGTTMILTHAGVPADSPGAMGWNMALDKLEEAARAATA